MGSEFRAKHTLLTFHIWLLHRAVLRGGEDGKDLQVTLFDNFWHHTFKELDQICNKEYFMVWR